MRRSTLTIVIVHALAVLLIAAGCGGGGGTTTSQESSQLPQAGTEPATKTAAAGAASTTTGGTGDCPVVDGQKAASALGGAFAGSKNIANAPPDQVHCTLTINIIGADRVFVIWQMPAGDYEDLKAAEEDPVSDLGGIGEKAFITFHPDQQRYDLAAVKAGKLVEVTGEDQEQVKQVVMSIFSQ